MKPVTQSRVGENGRCFPACLASILEIPEKQVPDFPKSDDEFYAAVDRFLDPYNLQYRQVPITDATPMGWHTIEGISPRGGQHAIVGFNGKPVHDPHPQDGTGRGLVEPNLWGLLLPLTGRATQDRVAVDMNLFERKSNGR